MLALIASHPDAMVTAVDPSTFVQTTESPGLMNTAALDASKATAPAKSPGIQAVAPTSGKQR